MKLHQFLIFTSIVILTSCASGVTVPTWRPQKVVHQNVEAASKLKEGMSIDEVTTIMGGTPIRRELHGDIAILHYCDTFQTEAHHVALFFSTKSNKYQSQKKYTIFWEETKDMVVTYEKDIVLHPSNYQLNCKYTVQDKGVKDINHLSFWVTDGDIASMREDNRRDDEARGYGSSSGGGSNWEKEQERMMREREQHNAVNRR